MENPARSMLRTVRAAAVACPLFFGTLAHAQQASTTGTAAVLFDQGVALMEQGRYREACPKLARSNELSPNGGTLFALAECYEMNGQVASAWVTYKEAAIRATAAKRDEAVKRATASAAKLEPQVSRLTIEVPKPVEGLSVTLDSRPVTRAEWGVATPIDPGEHVLRASAPGRVSFSQPIKIEARATEKAVGVPVLDPAPPGPPRGRGQRIAGLLIGGVGVAGLAVGTVFGLQASRKNDEAATHCRDGNLCGPEGIRLDEEGRDAAMISTISFIAGGALAVGGLVVVLTAPSGRERPVSVGIRPARGGGAFTLGGVF